ncbi:hypothetical protein CFC21_087143 [Triticum aestivum]|uniref:Secreted protein n=3 Tax=Triticum TaxID=4564 RepID=A0A9R0YG75_TRITD|nr:hypothetical protein CFC21_087143 [Triticum aestivum]VAI54820.1 unnamed protein product [Triticum turgidum subsp. durum]
MAPHVSPLRLAVAVLLLLALLCGRRPCGGVGAMPVPVHADRSGRARRGHRRGSTVPTGAGVRRTPGLSPRGTRVTPSGPSERHNSWTDASDPAGRGQSPEARASP